MSDFSDYFLNEDWENSPDVPRVYLGAFGKHPGWNDHLDDIGLSTGSLLWARRLLYGVGIASQIENATWKKAGSAKTLSAFNHHLLWRRSGESIAGRIWSSRDGKGRSLYPMCTLVHCLGQRFEWIADEVMPLLERAESGCMDASTASGVLAVLDNIQNVLREKTDSCNKSIAAVDSPMGVADWTSHFRQDNVSLQRLLHYVCRNLAVFTPGVYAWCGKDEVIHSRCLRLPVVDSMTSAGALNGWLSFLATQIDPAVPLLGVIPHGQRWLDVFVGEPAAEDFFALKANLEAVPLVTEIPYQIDEDVIAVLPRILSDLSQGRLPSASILNNQSVSLNREVADKWLARIRTKGRNWFLSRLLSPADSRKGIRFLNTD